MIKREERTHRGPLAALETILLLKALRGPVIHVSRRNGEKSSGHAGGEEETKLEGR